ncbi:glycoside hydrolase family 3 N-terminal domain-containing protein [Kribbella speibonae]|uniref:beta-N-acetylhexosaminidase n=1 Tax=Kribbella speibonae TaxID=1572660 RepID=A0A4R0IEE2_9ACTN|nr:glycoside hydrolase family 3 N-terminal domain-containing protein [Kribbella speibonae]TCC28007.1 glycoside hydrolase family 3 protein [Kribbella speibonae]TCC29566.1 glycoside hydrolase family 3 protein [Kribbella speibonae]
MRRPVALIALTALAVTGCGDSGSPTAGPSTVPSSSIPVTDDPPTTPTDTPTNTPSETPSKPPTSKPPTSAAGCVDQKLRTLTLREKAAQLIMTGINSTGMTSAQRAVVQQEKSGSVFLIGNGGSLSHTRTAMAAVNTAATVKGVRPLIAADQEGGQIQRLKGSGFDRIPAATVQGTWSSSKLTAQAQQWGSQLKEAGVNVDLAPVADVVPSSLKSQNAPIGQLDREYGDTPEEAGQGVRAFVQGMRNAGIATSVKHFPGLGRVRGNTDFSSGVVDNVTERGDADLQPFADGIKAGTSMVMISTVTYTKIDPKNRAVFSPTVIQGMVRGDLGWRGVVITDDVGAAAEVAAVPAGERATRFVAAGGDIVINAKAGLTADMVGALVAKAQQDKFFAAQLTSSVRRVLTLKEDYGLVSCG